MGRRGLEPRTSAVIGRERCAYESGRSSVSRGVMWSGRGHSPACQVTVAFAAPAYVTHPTRPALPVESVIGRPACVLIGLVLAACGGGPAATSANTTVTVAPTSAASSASPTAARGIPSCRLPVGRPQFHPDNPSFTIGFAGGFFALPGGQYVDEPEGDSVLEIDGGRGPSVYKTTAAPVLRGSNATLSPAGAAMSYDAPFARWLPVPRASVSPDGVRYAYIDTIQNAAGGLPASRVHIVDVKTGDDRLFVFPGAHLAASTQWFAGVVAFKTEGVYLSLFGSNRGSGPDTGKLWLLDPDRGTTRQVSDVVGNSWLVAGAYAWTFVSAPGGSTNPNTLVRIDLSTGQRTTWWVNADYEPVSSPGAVTELSVLAVDEAGSPIVEGSGEAGGPATYTRVVDIWVIGAPNQPVPLDLSAAAIGSGSPIGWEGALTDSFGTWILLNDRLFLYDTGGTFRKVAEGPYSPAGTCIS